MQNGIVALEGMEFFAYHGFYKEEQRIGNKYSVDLKIETDFSAAAQEDNLEGTIDYEQVYDVVRKEMLLPKQATGKYWSKNYQFSVDPIPDHLGCRSECIKIQPSDRRGLYTGQNYHETIPSMKK